MNRNLKNIAILSLPLLLKYFFLLITLGFNVFNIQDLIEDVVFCVIIGVILHFVVGKKRYLANSLYIIYILYFVLEGTSYLAMSTNFTSSYMYLLVESSAGELREFYHSYLSLGIIFLIVILSLIFVFLVRIRLSRTSHKRAILGAGLSIGLAVLLKFTGLIESNAYHNIVRGLYGYYELQDNFKMNSSIKKENVTQIADNDVLVVVLGESTARGHMQLYGYNRNTNPYLNSIKDSLYQYNDVISTDVFTLKAVPKMLTSIANDNENKPISNIVDVFNKAGLKTYWLSNQRPISYHDNAISSIASQASYFKFYNHKIDKHTTVLDEVMLPRYNEILDEEGRKVIFIRLIGTHFDYDKRYPPSFNKFIGEKKSKEETAKNHYDNAVLYNDYIIHSLLSELKIREGKSTLIYLSDHGENVYEEGDFLGRLETNVKKNMLDIPFLVWTSKDFEFPEDFEYVPNRKFMTDHLYDSMGHLFGVRHSSMNFSNSIFSKYFKERERIVVNGINYDEHFVSKHE